MEDVKKISSKINSNIDIINNNETLALMEVMSVRLFALHSVADRQVSNGKLWNWIAWRLKNSLD